MYKFWTLILAGALIASSVAAPSLIQVPNDAVNRKILRDLDLDYACTGSTPEHLNFVLDEEALQKLGKRRVFKRELMKASQIILSNTEVQFEKIVGQDDLGVYHNFDEMVVELEDTVNQFPGLASLEVGASTYEGRSVYVLTLTDSSSTQEKTPFLITGTHHAREWISTEVPLAFIQYMVNGFGNNDIVTELLKTSTFVIVPMLNPDGGVYSRQKSRMWRKNRNKVKGKMTKGIDNNRNYPYKWGGRGASASGWSQTYRGPKAASEIETQLVINLQEQHGFKAAVSFHSYSELILWPWGYTNKIQTTDHDIFRLHGNKMGEIMGYRPMQASGLYEASGIFDDTLYATYGVLAYTVELGRQFVPREEQVPEINEKSINALLYLFTNARDPFAGRENTPLLQSMRKLERLVASLEPGASKEFKTDAINSLTEIQDKTLMQGMQGLKMHSMLRSQIMDMVQTQRKHQEIYR
jgi:carboxypeptidase T